jgi:hypothetical protein
MNDSDSSEAGTFSSHAGYLSHLLDEIIIAPSKFKDNLLLRAALKSQGSFARYAAPGKRGVSLNTLKTQANLSVIGGFANLDSRRHEALRLLDESSVETSTRDYRSKAAIAQRNKVLQKDLIRLYCDMWQLTSAFGRALGYYSECANNSGSPETIALCKRHVQQLYAAVSPSQLQKIEQELRRRLRLELVSLEEPRDAS